MPSKYDAKEALDIVIRKSRMHFYKPIQIAEILYRHRTSNDIDLLDLETYRTRSKRWRDDICAILLGRKCTSSAKFQDDLFNSQAIPPAILNELGRENKKTDGAVEAYIYQAIRKKYGQLDSALAYCSHTTADHFDITQFLDSFWHEPGLKRSLDKIYEIIVYALFSTLVEALKLQVEISIDSNMSELLFEFEDFTKMVMCIDFAHPRFIQDARVYRVGVTNAADRGLDMYSNWGPAIQIKHLCLDIELAEEIVSSISSDRIVIVCKEAERDIIVSLLTQIGWRSHIQSIITENNLTQWYEKALRGTYSHIIGNKLLACLRQEIAKEFPVITGFPAILQDRHYETISDSFWQ